MGNAVYGDKLTCYETLETCVQGCGKYDCVYVDKCNGSPDLTYVCLPFDMRFFMWIMVGVFLVTVLICSGIVACYALRAIRASFRNSLRTDGDIVFYNARNVHTFPHPANGKWRDDQDSRSRPHY
ncbi:unnamed protein product [Bursaphelenchus okinawaensis]|uniref:Uncharacterized protein n=1 Tax=Bursaphelenchus okinawaensis TaxID=465554 RepID=A0A811LLW2_9BILA|nr:unnamed protein product [Bursaphelenchus okinawaensis]CAG9126157.1 unnamed protein product [Bursaphelenchus okinawaensis]